MSANNPNNLPIYKRPEYRIIAFLVVNGYRWLQRNLSEEVYRDLRKPLTEIKKVLSESLYGEKYKIKGDQESRTSMISLSQVLKDVEADIRKKSEGA